MITGVIVGSIGFALGGLQFILLKNVGVVLIFFHFRDVFIFGIFSGGGGLTSFFDINDIVLKELIFSLPSHETLLFLFIFCLGPHFFLLLFLLLNVSLGE